MLNISRNNLVNSRPTHTFLTHLYLFLPEKIPPVCDICDPPLTVNHILSECNTFLSLKISLKVGITVFNVLHNNSKEIDKL